MAKILPRIYNALYLSIFLLFARKILDKVSLMFDECVPMVNEDDNDWFGVRLFHRFFIFSNISKEGARSLAMQIYREVPELRGHIEVVQHEDPDETAISELRGVSQDAKTILYEIWEQFEED